MIENRHINLAINYILTNINNNITVEEIANHCNFSKHYFSRLFKQQTGEGVHQFVKRIKMEQSALRLKAEKSRSITDIGGDYGFSSSNYSCAFKQHLNISPVNFRKSSDLSTVSHPVYSCDKKQLEDFDTCSKKISIEVLEDFLVIFERHKDSYKNLSKHWGNFQEKYSDYITSQTLFVERSYDDPSITDTEDCLCDICMTAPKNCTLPNTYIINGGKFAIYHFKGDLHEIFFAFQTIFSVWLTQSGNLIDDRYSFEIYRKIDCDTNYMEIDICIPIK